MIRGSVSGSQLEAGNQRVYALPFVNQAFSFCPAIF